MTVPDPRPAPPSAAPPSADPPPATGAPALRPMQTAARADRLRPALEGHEIDALLITELANVRYLTGFSGSAGMVLVLDDRLVLATDGRYGTQAERELAAAGVTDVELVVGGLASQRDGLIRALSRIRASSPQALPRLGLEAAHVTWSQQQAMAAAWRDEVQLVPTEGMVEALRACKDEGEIDRLERAAAIADAALAATLPRLEAAPTEAEFALALELAMRERGAEAVSFPTIVAAGLGGAEPHHQPTAAPVQPGQLVTVDFGALVDGYHSDMTRTVCVGEPATAQLAEMVEAVRAAQACGAQRVGPGTRAADIDRACRASLEEAGYGDAFVHPTGHGVGLHIHEAPAVSAISADTLQSGHVVTVEPGVYVPGVGGVRIEDTLVVTDTGARAITRAPKQLMVSAD